MIPEANVKLVLRYFEACNTGDLVDLDCRQCQDRSNATELRTAQQVP